MNTNKYRILLLISGIVLILLPLFTRPDLFLSRGNDLQEFFWPLMTYSSKYVLKFHTIPFWNPLWFGGMPLIADPQAPIWYPLNIIFLIFSIKSAFLIGISLHIALAAFFTYKAAKLLNYSKNTSVVMAIIFIFLPRLASSIEAGLWGLIVSWGWIPAFIYQSVKIQKGDYKKDIFFLSLTISFLYLAHSITAMIVIAFVFIVNFLYTSRKIHFTFRFAISAILAIGFLAPVLIPQLLWQSETTRYLLLLKPDTYPKWTGQREFVESIFNIPKNYDTEKVITIGSIPFLTILLSFFVQKKKFKMIFILISLPIILIAMNNISLFSSLISSSKLFSLLRVTTRVWIIVFISMPFVIGLVLDKVKRRSVFYILSVAIITSCGFTSLQILSQPASNNFRLREPFYSEFNKDKSDYRIYCPDRCLSQMETANNNLLTIDGYATLIPKNFYIKSWGLFGGYWDYYTLSLPPFGATKFQNLKLDADSLGEYNAKYVVLKDNIQNGKLKHLFKYHDYYVYQNTEARGYVYSQDNTRKIWETLKYSEGANSLVINTDNSLYKDIVVSQTFTNGFTATTDKNEQTLVNENPSSLIAFTVPSNTKTVTLTYNPPGFRLGTILFIVAIIFTIILLLV